MATLTLNNIKKTYKDSPVIENLSVTINNGELIVVVGPSGCGKSTVLRMIAGLEEITGGDIKLNGNVINNLSPKQRNIAMVFQNYALYPHMTVYNNMAYGLKMRKVPMHEIDRRVKEAASILELSDLLERKPSALSGGQRQRVAMGRAIVRKPDLFLFDEPLSNLDAKLRVQMRLQIRKLQENLKTTSIYVTHDQVEAMTLADRLIVLNKGRVEQIGTPLEVYDTPSSTFVGGFIGTPAMNFLHADISHDQKSLEFWGGFTLPLPEQYQHLKAGVTYTVGIRPERIRVAKHADVFHFKLQLKTIETLGADTLLYGTLPNNTQLIVVRLPGKYLPTLNDEIEFELVADSLHLFDNVSGLRVL